MANVDQPKNILITGANGGLGPAQALACARRGARVILLDRKRKPLEALCDEVEALDAPAPGYVDLDLAQAGPDAFQELVAGLEETYGALNGLAHCHARFDGLRPLDQVTPQDWLMDVQVNLNATWLLTISCLSSLKAGAGRVAFVLDSEARGKAYWGAYGVSKAALEGLAATLAEELEGTRCAVTAFDPGPLRTGLRAAAFLAEDPATIPSPDESADRLADFLLGSGDAPTRG